MAGLLAAIPAGAALAGSSDSSSNSGDGDSAGAVPAQSTTPDGRQRGDGDRGDCPEKDGQQSQGSAQI